MEIPQDFHYQKIHMWKQGAELDDYNDPCLSKKNMRKERCLILCKCQSVEMSEKHLQLSFNSVLLQTRRNWMDLFLYETTEKISLLQVG